ncbi:MULTISPECIES: carboxymuconolactone decarboxylase family protein [unclassified Pseudofrankia]|uniref:carboxymuconolactone decarboxylase family protein n=1 Tax=unclassified Pseudofrankia TaxID=2994372 RepID=UPI0008D96C8F|nr:MULTISPECIES: carboxymuconolactone decarboxylase family protein [unclassified Pseudofrankia]MDT3440718.1 carboxymuconolactone decarboxylase family protein [Pseudofrankia sp. BMG5.37]OHV58920.1 hypothetical protein BCD48_05775 [Pseudofrankia sp. BMG5.36]
MKLTVHTAESAPAEAAALLRGIADDLGVVPNMAAAMASSPALLAGFDGLRRALGTARLPRQEREIAGLAVGVAVDNAYGVAFHSTMLDQLGAGASDVDAMRGGREPDQPRAAAVYALARSIALGRGKVDDTVLDRASSVGLDDSLILDIVLECALASLVGTVDNLADRVEIDGFLHARAR